MKEEDQDIKIISNDNYKKKRKEIKFDNQPSRGTYHFNRDDTNYLTTNLTNNEDDLNDEDFDESGEQHDGEKIENEEDNNNESETGIKKKKQNWFSKAKKGVISKATSSSAGKALFNKFVDKETKNLINAMCIIEEKEGGYEKGRQMKSDIYRIAVKIIILYQDKLITERDFGNLKSQFRKVCSSLKNGYRTGKLEETTAHRIETHIIEFCVSTRQLITPFLSKHTMDRLDRLQETLGSSKWLIAASIHDEFTNIVYACAHYLEELRGR